MCFKFFSLPIIMDWQNLLKNDLRQLLYVKKKSTTRDAIF